METGVRVHFPLQLFWFFGGLPIREDGLKG
jgi:hypothetical protein